MREIYSVGIVGGGSCIFEEGKMSEWDMMKLGGNGEDGG
jgi:hypothetical protein